MQKRLICIEKYINKIINGNSLEVLKKIPANLVDMVITSPPYWALRDYGVKPDIWDGKEGCDHDWHQKTKKWHSDRGSGKSKEVFDDSFQVKGTKHAFCRNCGAWKGELGLEPTFDLYIKHLCDIFDEIKRVLKDGGTCWVNLGDTYHNATKWTNKKQLTQTISKGNNRNYQSAKREDQGIPEKCLSMIPERFAIEMTNRKWILRNQIIWHKPNCMPASVKDRFTVDFEKIFFFSKSKNYYFEQQYDPMSSSSINRLHQNIESQNGSVRANGGAKTNGNMKAVGDLSKGRNKRCVWTICPKPFKEAHFAVYPPELIETPIKAGCPENGLVLDPFLGSGTTALVAFSLRRNFLGIELNPEYIKITQQRLKPYLEQLRLF